MLQHKHFYAAITALTQEEFHLLDNSCKTVGACVCGWALKNTILEGTILSSKQLPIYRNQISKYHTGFLLSYPEQIWTIWLLNQDILFAQYLHLCNAVSEVSKQFQSTSKNVSIGSFYRNKRLLQSFWKGETGAANVEWRYYMLAQLYVYFWNSGHKDT